MKRIIFLLFNVIALSLALPFPAWSDSTSILTNENLPPEFEASYEIYKGSLRVGEMQVSLKKVGEELIYQSKTKPVGMAALFLGDQTINDRAVLRQIDNSYRTIEFRHEMNDKKKNRNEHYLFDWDNNKASVKYKDESKTLDITEHTFDNYSAQLLLMREFIHESNNENAKFSYSVISKGRLKQYEYQQQETELITTKLGEFDSNKFVRKKDNDKKTTYFGWYAEKLNYIPVKLDKFENDKLDVSVQITAIKWLNQSSDNTN